MAVSRNGDFQLLDYTGLFEVTPRVNKLATQLGLFQATYGTTTVAQIERVVETTDDIQAQQRGGERGYASSEVATIKNFNIPFFPLDRQIKRNDIQNFRAYGDPNAPKTVEQEVQRVMARLRRSHANLFEKALITAMFGTSYAPNDANATYNWYTEWGVSASTANIDFTAATVDPRDVVEASARKVIIEKAGDNASEYEVMALCSPTWFSAFIGHPLVEEAYVNYPSQQEPLRDRLGGNTINRIFTTKGVTYIEDISGYVTAGKAVIFPVMPDVIEVVYAPADTFADLNTPASEAYVWYKESEYLREAKVESETSFLVVNKRPELFIQSTGTFA